MMRSIQNATSQPGRRPGVNPRVSENREEQEQEKSIWLYVRIQRTGFVRNLEVEVGLRTGSRITRAVQSKR
jgi:hypothetical protein